MRRSYALGALITGVPIVMAAALWNPAVVPQLTKLPSDLHATADYQGTFTSYVDPATGAMLPAPVQMPMTMKRVLKTVPGKGSGNSLVVTQGLTFTMGGKSQEINFQYVVDRSTRKNLKGAQSWAIAPSNVVDRQGSYPFSPPMNASTSKSYAMWQEEIGAPLKLVSKHSSQTVGGVKAELFSLNTDPVKMSPSYLAASKMPTSMPFSEFVAQAKASGTDLAAVLGSLMPVLTSSEKASFAALQKSAIGLDYYYSATNDMLVEPTTGTVVKIGKSHQEITLKPNLAGLTATLTPVFMAHMDSPVIQRLIPAMGSMGNVPTKKITTTEYAQTPASVSSTAKTASDALGTLKRLTLWVPVLLALIGALLIAAAWKLGAFRRGPAAAGAGAGTVPSQGSAPGVESGQSHERLDQSR
jgi:hypothetical protein